MAFHRLAAGGLLKFGHVTPPPAFAFGAFRPHIFFRVFLKGRAAALRAEKIILPLDEHLYLCRLRIHGHATHRIDNRIF